MISLPNLSRFYRFVIVGSLTAGIYFFGYNLLREGDLISPMIAAAIAYLIAILFQYFGHAWFTFRKPFGNSGQVGRFLLTNGFGLGVSVALTLLFTSFFLAPDWITSAIVVVVLPIANWVIMRLWVFT